VGHHSAELQNQNCLIVGGGDTASEYCQYLVERGNRVSLSYRGAEFSRLNSINYESLMALERRGQVTILRGSNVKELQEERSSDPLADLLETNKRVVVCFEEETFPSETFDHIIYALGGTTPTNFLKSIGIAFDGDRPVIKEGYETSVPGLYLIGDLSAGRKGGSINLAFNMAQKAMPDICGRAPDLCES